MGNYRELGRLEMVYLNGSSSILAYTPTEDIRNRMATEDTIIGRIESKILIMVRTSNGNG